MWNLNTNITEKHPKPTVMKPYQEVIIKRLIDSDYFLTSGEMHLLIEDELGEKAISRASVIFFMKDLHEWGYAHMEKGTCKGVVHSRYNITMTTEQFIQKLRNHLTKSLADAITDIFI